MKLEDIILFSMDLYVIHTLSLWMDSSTPPESEVPLEKLTKQPKLVKRSYSHLCVQRSKIVERKIMLYPAPTNRHKPAFYISTDTKKTTFNQNLTLSHHTRATHKHFTPLQLRSPSAPSPVTVGGKWHWWRVGAGGASTTETTTSQHLSVKTMLSYIVSLQHTH